MIKKIRFIEPGTYLTKKSFLRNNFAYSIKNPGIGLITLTTIARKIVDDTLMYSESISEIKFDDVYDADIVFISIFTFSAKRGYEIAEEIKKRSGAIIVFGGLHASLHHTETINYCDFILTGDGDELIVDFIKAINDDKQIDFPGVIYKKNGEIINTGERIQPENIDTIPDRHLVYKYAKLAKRSNTLWPQVHASRGCPHNCAYCSIILHFGRRIRKKTPENVVADIKESIKFHKNKFFPRLMKTVWLTDDNFAQDRNWAIEVLNEIIKSKINYNFYVQARIEIGFDDEILELMRKAGFHHIALGIESLDDDNLKNNNKNNKYTQIIQAINNIKKHNIDIFGLFMVGFDEDAKGIGEKIANFVKEHNIHGALVQSLFFTPGTVYYEKNKDKLIHHNWDKYDGNVIHYPKNMKPYELQQEIISASKKIYSFKRVLYALLTYRWIAKVIFTGMAMWQIYIRKELKKELKYLKSIEVKNIS